MEAAWSISIWRFPGNGNSQSSLEARARVGELRGWISAIKNLPREIRTPSTTFKKRLPSGAVAAHVIKKQSVCTWN
ncbi:uncharacterized protein LOC125501113 isoform X3 [Athalia rosae]|uniref:uncharacterized protein LOC125501113 isoform X3 n=1 Tax=Athalia rosae TaxID=37344 RepID=UPI0020336A0E|nr:uncharacterized protein LOC125501113 isoform X3 [Athalia rosae]